MHVISIDRALAEAGSATRAADRLRQVAAWNARHATWLKNPRGSDWQRHSADRSRRRLERQAEALDGMVLELTGQHERMAA